MRMRDTFAGGLGGWDFAAEELGLGKPDGWEILSIARATRDAIGHITVGADVREIKAVPGEYELELSAPPCQGFSIMGQGKGRGDFDILRAGFRFLREGWPIAEVIAYVAGMATDLRTALVLEPLRLALEGEATYLAWEQVPTVQPVWDLSAAVLRDAGYNVATGILRAEQYGVPQCRKRAILLARRDGKRIELPLPTHAGWKQPVTMAEALKWGMTARPAMSVTAGGTGSGGGLEIWGNGARKGMRTEMDAGRWLDDGVQRWSASRKSIRVSTEDVLKLQSFDPETPVRGLIGQRTMQIGNAIPRLLALACLRSLFR